MKTGPGGSKKGERRLINKETKGRVWDGGKRIGWG